MSTEHTGLGASGLGELASRVLRTWQSGPGAEAEQLDTCECCGGLLGFEDPQERQMIEQWSNWTPEPRAPSSEGVGSWATGWPPGTASSGYSSRGATGWGGRFRDDLGV